MTQLFDYFRRFNPLTTEAKKGNRRNIESCKYSKEQRPTAYWAPTSAITASHKVAPPPAPNARTITLTTIAIT